MTDEPPNDMERLLNKRDLELQVQGKRADIEARIDALKDEVEMATEDAKAFVIREPLKILAGIAVTGVIIGVVVTGKRRRKARRRLKHSHRAIVERYVDALVDDVRVQIAKGRDAERALRSAFKDRIPLVVMEDESFEAEAKGIVRETLDFALKTALGFAVKMLSDRIADRIDIDAQIDRLVHSVVPAGDPPPAPPAPPAPPPTAPPPAPATPAEGL